MPDLTDEALDGVAARYRRGDEVDDIAAALDLSRTQVYIALRARDVELRPSLDHGVDEARAIAADVLAGEVSLDRLMVRALELVRDGSRHPAEVARIALDAHARSPLLVRHASAIVSTFLLPDDDRRGASG